jgi:hypothetical protein
MKLSIITILLLIITLLTQSGCDKDKPADNSKVVMVLFDLSETTNKPEIRKNYTESFKLVLQSFRAGDAIEVGLITENSIAQQRLPIRFELPLLDYDTDNTLLLRMYQGIADSVISLKVDSLWKIADSILTSAGSEVMKTDILGALKFSEKVLKSFPQKRKIIVLLSDMREDSNNYNFDNENLNPARIKNIIGQERSRNNLPDLSDVIVYIAGASAPTTTKYNQIQEFWLKYFEEAGALLEPHRYSSMLLKFDE